MADEQERLIAEALRAQAARTPLPAEPDPGSTTAPGLGLTGGGYRLLSGSDLPLPVRGPTARTGVATPTRRIEPNRMPVLAILVLAATLGLAAGAIIGLLTLV